MSIWIPFFNVLWQLRDAFPRKQTFLFFCVSVVGICIRSDTRGVTSFVRSLALKDACYHGFLRLFHCCSLDPGRLFDKWTTVVFKIFAKNIVTVNGRVILSADGLKIAKEGKRMPGVRSLHQESSNNTKPTWIMGHYFQVISVIAEGLGRSFAVPISARIHDGLRCSKSKEYREKMIQKFESCERFVFAGCVAQGILQYLASCYPSLVWGSFNSWYRSQLTTVSPTEEIVQSALKTRLFELFTSKQISPDITKFISEKTDKGRLSEPFLRTG